MPAKENQPVRGAIVVNSRTPLQQFNAGSKVISHTYVDGLYSGDLDGPAHETFIAVTHEDGTQDHYGFGAFSGKVNGRSGSLIWKFHGRPGCGTIEIVSGTGELQGLTGTVDYDKKEGSTTEFTYSGSLG